MCSNDTPTADELHVDNTVYLIRFTQSHVTFRKPELDAIAAGFGIDVNIVYYHEDSPFCLVQFSSRLQHTSDDTAARHAFAKSFISHSILAKEIYEFYAEAPTYDELHHNIQALPATTWQNYKHVSFKFIVEAFYGKRSVVEQRDIIESFGYLPFEGRIAMKKPDEEFRVFEEWPKLTAEQHTAINLESDSSTAPSTMPHSNQSDFEAKAAELFPDRKPKRIYFARYLGHSRRDLITKHDLKKRPYISTTSMDAELALVTASLALAAPGKLFLDPFTGTGGFMVAAAELGAMVLGSDIDGRSFRGKGTGLEKGVGSNFKRYKITDRFGDCITSDLTNTPFRVDSKTRWLDGIICDPPYGIREGLKVLGRKLQDEDRQNGRSINDGPYFVDGVPSHTLPGFIAPKRPYSFDAMLRDILEFATRTLGDGGRLAFWMPVANDADEEFPIPMHAVLEIRHVCIQVFNKWSRRLLVYERIAGEPDEEGVNGAGKTEKTSTAGRKADELNQFRRMYFSGFHATGQGKQSTYDPKKQNRD